MLELRPKLEPAAAFAMGFILSAGAVGTGSLPLAAGFLAGLHSSMCCLLGAVGAALGYWHFWEAAGIRQIAVTVCVLLAAAFFEGTHLRQNRCFVLPCFTACVRLRKKSGLRWKMYRRKKQMKWILPESACCLQRITN